jgi:glycosyltransferase involved in cell wall biosynthesis
MWTDLGVGDSCPLLGNVSRLAPVKDHLGLFQALDLIRSEFPHIKCMLIGDGPLREQLDQQVRIKHLSENVLFLGHQSHVADFIRIFDVAVSSSLYEGSSNFILEAMTDEKPIVATDVGGNRELVVDGINGFLVAKKDPQALAAAIVKLLKDEELRMTLGKAGRQRIGQELMLEQMLKKPRKSMSGFFRTD